MLRAAGYVAHVQGSQTFGTGTRDVDWLPHVGARGWILITKDKQIRKRELELRALRESGVRTFVLVASNISGPEQARVLSEALPSMLRLLRRRSSHFVARITSESSLEIIERYKYAVEKSVDE